MHGFALIFALCSAVFLPFPAQARLGESAVQCADRYGAPLSDKLLEFTDKNNPVLEGANHRTFVYQGWRIRAAFLEVGSPCVRLHYQKEASSSGSIQIRDFEVEAILRANAGPGQTWKPIAYDNPNSPNKGLIKAAEAFLAVGDKMWQRDDGAMAWLRGNLSLRLELPAAHKHEEALKRRKEQRARENVPQF